MTDLTGPLTIIELHASNMMRLRAVTIRPDPDDHVVVIGGANAAGKSSVLNSIAAALGGAAAVRGIAQPIRAGEEHAEVRIDLGRFVVTRRYDLGGKPILEVTSADGARFPSPQKFLDEFLGDLTFDPLAFTRLSPKEQLATLLPLVDLPFDLDELDAERQRYYDDRTIVGRERDRLKAQADAAPRPEPNLPPVEVSTEALLAEHRAAVAAATDKQATEAQAAGHLREASYFESRIVEIDAQLDQLRVARAEAVAGMEAAFRLAEERSAEADAIAVADTDAIEQRLADANATNAKIRAAAEHRRLHEAAQAKADEYDGLTFLIAEIDGRKKKAVADAAMPVDGLSFDDRQVYLNGIPFSQCSAAEQLRVSMAIGMAANPTIRVMCIADGALLDDNSMGMVRALAAEHEMQVWLERVGDSDEGAIIIEDGEVRQPQ